MELVYIYHSGFALLGDGYTVIMDYYRDTEDKQAEAALRRLMNEQPEEPVVAPEQGKVHDELLHRPGKLYVLASHFHPDHFNGLENTATRHYLYLFEGYSETQKSAERRRRLVEKRRGIC